MKKNSLILLITGVLGALLLVFVSWGMNMPLAVFIAPVLLVFYFRNQKKLLMTIPVAILSIAMKVLAMHGGWDISIGMELIFGVMVTAPLLTALYLDRWLSPKFNPFLATLVFPLVYTALDFLLAFSPVGMTFSVSYALNRQLALMQGSSLFGSWFVEFMVLWFAPVVNLVVSIIIKGQKGWKTVISYLMIMVILLGYGSAKQIFLRPQSQTVRIGSVTVEHPKDYWAITDAGTPRTAFDDNKYDIKKISDETFRLSQKLADYGAKIIFWSEGNTVMFEDQYDTFMKKASDFAKSNDVYLLAGIVALHYDSHKNDNLAVMIDPQGQVAYRYEKTISWYPTDSDGIIRKVETPYGKIGSAICFDMDFPNFIHQAADVDIMLIPAYDTKKISPFHTEVSFLRGIENGFSVVRQCNAGSSIAADYNGKIITDQDFYTTKERCMISDVPTKGIKTLYEITGEWFAYLCLAGLLAVVILGIIRKKPDVK